MVVMMVLLLMMSMDGRLWWRIPGLKQKEDVVFSRDCLCVAYSGLAASHFPVAFDSRRPPRRGAKKQQQREMKALDDKTTNE